MENKTLKITIPEDLDYTDIFDDIFEKYTTVVSLDKVKTNQFLQDLKAKKKDIFFLDFLLKEQYFLNIQIDAYDTWEEKKEMKIEHPTISHEEIKKQFEEADDWLT